MGVQAFDPVNPRIPLGVWAEEAIGWVTGTFEVVFDGIDIALKSSFDLLRVC